MDPELKKLNKLLLESESPKKLKPIFKKIIAVVILIIVLVSVVVFTPIFEKKEIVIAGQKGIKKVIDLGKLGLSFPSSIKDKERVNFLFLGIPGQGYSAPTLTDTIIIINSTPKGENPIAISIPRDLFVKFPNQEYYTKINAIYQDEGIKGIKSVIKEITDFDIDYFLVLDLTGVEKLVDKFNGIDVLVENDIYDPNFPKSDGSQEIFSLEKGWHRLDGETALKYIRTRYEPTGDFARIKRQQQVIGVLKDKILSLNLFWNFPTILSIWKTLNNHIHTNIGLTDLKYARNLAKRTDFNEIKFITLSNQPDQEKQLLISDHATLGGKSAYILKPRAGNGNYSEIKNYINQLINSL